ncbi:hypothetical protein E5676_scaffold111G00760 [Cucumis melo var. makuwa]|uniref:Uncharacterized protein n=1 Tax=Cucumis melo var. makuwa TaxID=1194695 RepID=A0A5D3DRC7_CUCMM|nr:hypothetical protein E6C27_scaffold54G001760 [Cucumis melo var. makuwa]TYK26154.1 hypothetical protein E5676_scaffold111G00760 [Cucumis melo var. makuwa]
MRAFVKGSAVFLLKRNLGYYKVTTMYNFPNKMVLAFNMLSPFIGSRFVKNFLSHTASFAASQAATYSASIVESAIQFYFMLLHTTAPPFRVIPDPDVDFLASLSVWKSESVPMITSRIGLIPTDHPY